MKKKIAEEVLVEPVEETPKVAPLILTLSGLGEEKLKIVADKLNEVIAFINR